MTDFLFFESQALSAASRQAANILGMTHLSGLPDQLGEKEPIVNDLLGDLLADERFSDCVEISTGFNPPPAADALGWRIGRKTKDGVTRQMRFYKAKSVWKTQAASLVGIALALALTPINPFAAAGAVAPTLVLVATAWDNLVKLERPQDGHAIDAYEALLKAELTGKNDTATGPTTAEIHAASGQTDIAVTLAGLKRLKDLGLVDVAEWGSLSGDVDAPGNRWFQTF